MKNIVHFVTLTIVVISCRPNTHQHEEAEPRIVEDASIINLYDAFGESDNGLTMDFGFSCVLNYKGKTILFDAGSNADIFKSNVERLNIDLSEIDFAVASHAHFDHINGFDYLLKVNPDVKIYFPFDPFWGANFSFNLTGQDSLVVDSLEKRMQYFNGDFKDYAFNQSGRFWNANVEFVRENTEILSGIKLIATKSSNMGYFTKYPLLAGDEALFGKNNTSTDQANFSGLKELSLSLSTDQGEVVVVGCSHSTVEQIITETKAHTGNNISLVYGGYHLLPYDRNQLIALASRLKGEHGVSRVAPAHCTGHLAFKLMKDEFQENYLFAGLGSVTKW